MSESAVCILVAVLCSAVQALLGKAVEIWALLAGLAGQGGYRIDEIRKTWTNMSFFYFLSGSPAAGG